MNLYLDLFLTFLRVGLFTFGGGYAMIPLIEDICVDKKKWITHEDMMNITVIAESTPGPVAINCSTFVGCRQAGVLGALVATFGMVLPSFVVIFIISKFLDRFLEIAIVANAFKGIKIAVGLLIINAALNMFRKMEKDMLSRCLLIGGAFVMLLIDFFSLKFSSILLMLIAAAISLAAYIAQNVRSGKGGRRT